MPNGPSHVAIFLQDLGGGGAERIMVTLATELANYGVQIDLVLSRAEGPLLSEVPQSVRVVNLNARRLLSSLRGLVRYLRDERPDTLLSTLVHANVGAILSCKMAATHTRIVIREANHFTTNSQRVSLPRIKLAYWIAPWVYPLADGIVAVSHGVANNLRCVMRLPAGVPTVIYNPVITPSLLTQSRHASGHPWLDDPLVPVVLGVGRLVKQKDFPTLIKAFALVRRQRRARLVILGEGNERVHLLSLADRLGVRHDVSLPGFVDNPFAYMSRASVFALSSAWEGLPGALIQAMACGCPVVSTDCPSGPAEVLDSGRYGYLTPVGDAQALADVIEKVLAGLPKSVDPTWLTQFSMDSAVEHYAQVLGLSITNMSAAHRKE